MNEHQAYSVRADVGTNGAPTSSQPPSAPTSAPSSARSGVFSRQDGGGWGLVLVDLGEPPRVVPLSDGVVIGVTGQARLDGGGVAAEHARVSVRADGCYLDDLGTDGGTFVGGVRARRIGVGHGDVVRLGTRLAIFVERDLVMHAGGVQDAGGLALGPRSRRAFVEPVLAAVKAGQSVCIEGGPGLGKRTLARFAATLREAAGEVMVVDGRAEPQSQLGSASGPRATVVAGARPATWVLLDVDRLPRPLQLEIAHAIGRTGATIIATTNQPLDRAVADGKVAPWFAQALAGRRVKVSGLDQRREDILPIVAELARRHSIAFDRLGPEVLESLMRAGWPGGVAELEIALTTAMAASEGGPISPAAIGTTLVRPSLAKPSLPPSSDPSLARARLEDALSKANGSVAAAARALGMSRQAIYREADRLGLAIARRKLRQAS